MRLLSHAPGPLPSIPRRSAAWPTELDQAIVPSATSAQLLERLRQPGALVVTTGQQPGLFAGPLYAVHKPLAAAALARALEQRWRCPVVPIYWVAGDDHDFREASVAAWLSPDGEPIEFRLPLRPDAAPQRSMAHEPLPPEVLDGLTGLAASLPEGAHATGTLDWLRHHYQPGRTLHGAAVAALAELLAPYGILCLDATHPALKRAQVSLIRQALDDAGALDELLLAVPASERQVTVESGSTLVFFESDAGRERLVRDGDAFLTRRSRRKLTRADLEGALRTTPERFSANVLLRPIVESAVLPTVAYVAGPAEMRYLTRQAAPLYAHFGVTPQQPVPRWSGTLIEEGMDRLLQRLDLTAEAVMGDDGTIEAELIRRAVPGSISEALDRLQQEITEVSGHLVREGIAIDPVLERAVQGRQRRLEFVVEDLRRLMERHVRKRGDISHRQFRRLRSTLMPFGTPQERIFGPATWLGRHGTAWLDLVASAADEWAGTLP